MSELETNSTELYLSNQRYNSKLTNETQRTQRHTTIIYEKGLS